MKRRIPLTIVLILGFLMIIQFFIPHKHSTKLYFDFLDWLQVIGGFAFVLGLGSIIQLHIMKIRRKREHWEFSWILIVAMILTAIIGLFGGLKGRGPLPVEPVVTVLGKTFVLKYSIQTIFDNVITPLGSTMFALLAFFMATAAYRAFRARTFEATLLLATAFVVMLGIIPLGHMLWEKIPYIAQWILDIPNTAAKRGITMGVALGIAATSLKIILGIERGWLGGTK